MAGNEGLFTSINMLRESLKGFDESVQRLKSQRSLQSANEQIDQIRMSEASDYEKEQAIRGIAGQLAGSIGIEGAKGFADLVSPKPPTIQSNEQALYYGISSKNKPVEDEARRQLERDRQAKIEANTLKPDRSFDKERRKELINKQGLFARESRKIATATNSARNAVALLKSGNPLTPNIIGSLMARASGEVGNLTEAERGMFQGRSDYFSGIMRFVEKKSFSDLPEADKKALRQVAEMYANQGATMLEEFGTLLGNQLKATDYYANDDVDTLVNRVTGGQIRKSTQPTGTRPSAMAPSAPTGGLNQTGSLKSILIPRGGGPK